MPQSPSGGPDGYVFLMGCRPWPPPPEPDGRCPVCKSNTPHRPDTSVCGVCHAATPAMGRYIRAQGRRVRNADAGDVADRERRAKADLKAKHGKGKLPESERRRLWLGSAKRHDHDFNEVRTAARQWLREIGQEPDWSLVLDRRGNVIGRVEPCEPAPAPESCSGCPTPACGSA